MIYSVAKFVKLTLNHVNSEVGFKILLANRGSTKQILLAQQEIHWQQASGPVLISTPDLEFLGRYVRNIEETHNWKFSRGIQYGIIILPLVISSIKSLPLQQELKELSSIKAELAGKLSETNGKVHVIMTH